MQNLLVNQNLKFVNLLMVINFMRSELINNHSGVAPNVCFSIAHVEALVASVSVSFASARFRIEQLRSVVLCFAFATRPPCCKEGGGGFSSLCDWTGSKGRQLGIPDSRTLAVSVFHPGLIVANKAQCPSRLYLSAFVG